MKNRQKLLNYSAMAGAALATSNVNAQTIYTDVNPDQTFSFASSNQVYGLDMDNDFTVDFEISLMSLVGNMFVATPEVSANEIGLVYMSGTDYLRAFSANQVIDSNVSFGGNSSTGLIGGLYATAYGFPITVGSFPGQGDRYIGVRFDIAGQPHYGWARVDVASDVSSFTIKDYAYNATPNAPISAGATATDISNFEMEDVKIKTFPNNKVMVVVLDEYTNGTVIVTSISGKTVKKEALTEGANLLSLDELTTGMYVVSAQFTEGAVRKKIVVQ
jgi:hypothetical protein